VSEPLRATVDVTADWLAPATAGESESRPVQVAPGQRYVSSVVRPMARLIEKTHARAVGIAGPVGSGKSTLAAALSDCLSAAGKAVLAASLDDFYFSKAKRAALGFEFRASPGTHDLDALRTLLSDARAGVSPLVVPRFDASIDDCGVPDTLARPIDITLIDGWLVGLSSMGYETLLSELDIIVHLRIPAALAREQRFAREAALRERTGRGLSPAQMERFWQDVLGPGGTSWVRDAEAHADIVLDFDRAGVLRSVLATDELLAALRGADGDSPRE
jgi:uridine kinase